MRMPQPRTQQPVSLNAMRAPGGTQPSRARVAGGTTGPQGTPGGKPRKQGTQGRMILGQEVYLWILVLIEAFLTGALRRFFRKFHGG